MTTECKSNANGDAEKQVFEDHCWIHGTKRIGSDPQGLGYQKHFDCILRVSKTVQ